MRQCGSSRTCHMPPGRPVLAPLEAEDFKPSPEGHMGGSLNMAIAFAGYLAANALSGHTRAWTLGQGHCVAAIEAVNALTGDVSAAQRGRYDRSEAGLTRLVRDFYSYADDVRWKAGRSPWKPRESKYGRRPLGRRVPRLCQPAIYPHAVAGRAPGRLSERRRFRGAARIRLGAALVARQRQRLSPFRRWC